MFPPSSPNTNTTGSNATTIIPTIPTPVVPPYSFNGWTITPPNVMTKDGQITAMQNLVTKFGTDMASYQAALLAYDNASAALDTLKATKDANQTALDTASAAFNSYTATLTPGSVTAEQQAQIDSLAGPVIAAALNLSISNVAYSNGVTNLAQYEANVNTAKAIVAQDISLMANTWANNPSKMPYISNPSSSSS